MTALTEAVTEQKRVEENDADEVVIEVGDVQYMSQNNESYLAKTMSGIQPMTMQMPSSSLTQQQMFPKNMFLSQQNKTVNQEKPKQKNRNIFHGSAKADDNSEESANPEFLKAAVMQSYDCAKYLRICANFGLMSAKQEKMAVN